MYRTAIACTFVALLAAPAVSAAAGEVDSDTLAQVFEVATSKYDEPDLAEMRNVHKSLARNGQGYCGEIAADAGEGDFTVFHALLESALGPSVLLLSDFPEGDQSPNAVAARRMMHNFGCME